MSAGACWPPPRRPAPPWVDAHFHSFSPCGVTGTVSIQESHLSIHTWPEHLYAAVDIFTCGDSIDPWRAYESLKTALEADRGLGHGDSPGAARLAVAVAANGGEASTFALGRGVLSPLLVAP